MSLQQESSMTFLTPDQLAHLAELSRTATKEPWEHGKVSGTYFIGGKRDQHTASALVAYAVCDTKLDSINSEFIVTLRNACDVLLTEVAAGRRVVEAYEVHHSHQGGNMKTYGDFHEALTAYHAAGKKAP